MQRKFRSLLIQLRSKYSPSNRYRISRKAEFYSKANILGSSIIVPANNKVLLSAGARLRNVFIEIKGKNNELIIHSGTLVVGKIELFGNNNRLEIGENSRVEGGALMVHDGTKLTIGRECLIANGVDIRTSDSHPIFNAEGKIINPPRDIEIHDHVWFAKDVTVLKGVIIESNSVIGIKSIVTGNIPANSIAVGTPAKVVKSNITWSGGYPEN